MRDLAKTSSSLRLSDDGKITISGKDFVIYRINLDPIYVSTQIKDQVLNALAGGARYVQLAEITVMVSSISSIEPVKIRNKKWNEVLPHELTEVIESATMDSEAYKKFKAEALRKIG